MPNLSPPITTVEAALSYRDLILTHCTAEQNFDPKMTLYLTDETPVSEVELVADSEHILGFKLYPAGATTHSASGVTRIIDRMPIFEAMAKLGVVLQVHGEVTDKHVDVFDREAIFIEQVLLPLVSELPELKLVLEHITTSQGVEFVSACDSNIAATITPQHLLFNRNEMFRGGIRPHAYCLPILKRESHRRSLLAAATSGDPSFFLGTDSAPHTIENKETWCGCAGVFSANAAIQLYAEIFDGMESMNKLEAFASHHGADFYGVARNQTTITLEKSGYRVAERIADFSSQSDDSVDRTALIPLMAGENLAWNIAD